MTSKMVWGALWLLIFFLAVAWRAQNLDAFGLSNDEGIHLMWARLSVQGYALYREVYAVQPPLFLESLGWAFRLAGESVAVGRWAMLLPGFGLLALSLSWLAHRTGGWPGALLALLLTSLSPLIFTYSRLAMAEVPATALAVSAVALLVLYLERANRGWLLASGLLLGASFLFKALHPVVAVPAGLLLLVYHSSPRDDRLLRRLVAGRKRWGALLADLLLWGGAVCLPLLAIFVVYDPIAAYDQLVAFRSELRAAVPGSWAETGQLFEQFWRSHRGFWLLAFGGIIGAGWRFFGLTRLDKLPLLDGYESQANIATAAKEEAFVLYNLVWLAWLSAGLVMLLWHTPLFAHHFVTLLPPLILLGAGAGATLPVVWNLRRDFAARAVLVILMALALAALWRVPALVDVNNQTAAIVTGGREQEALRLLQAVSNPTDFLMGDSQLLIFMANRQTPPPLGDLALVGIKAGRQSSARLMALTQAYRAPAVVQWSLRLPWLPDYLAWVEQQYLARRQWDNDHIIYFAPRLPPDQPLPNAQRVALGPAITLRGFELDSSHASTARELYLKLYWQTAEPLVDDYTVFVQLLDGQQRLAAGYDRQPLAGYFPTSQWPAGEIVTDVATVPLPDDLAPGQYTLVTGMYKLDTLERLPVPGNPDNYVTLGTVEIQ